eukprot:2326087-Prymnesium_polylepis.1
MLPSGRLRAGAFDVGVLSTARGFALAAAERVFYAQVGPQGLRKNSERRRTSRPAPSQDPSHGWLRGTIQLSRNT